MTPQRSSIHQRRYRHRKVPSATPGKKKERILSRLYYADKKSKLVQPDPEIAFEFMPDCIKSQRLPR